MSKATDLAKIAEGFRTACKNAPTFKDHDGKIVASINTDAELIIERKFELVPAEALRLRDWLTDIFDEPRDLDALGEPLFPISAWVNNLAPSRRQSVVRAVLKDPSLVSWTTDMCLRGRQCPCSTCTLQTQAAKLLENTEKKKKADTIADLVAGKLNTPEKVGEYMDTIDDKVICNCSYCKAQRSGC